MFIHKDKKRFKLIGQRVARNSEEAADMLAKDLRSPVMEVYGCPFCKKEIVGTRQIYKHVISEHPKNASVFEINPNAYQEWLLRYA